MDPPQLRISPPQVVFPGAPHAPPPAPPPTATIAIGTVPSGAVPAAPVAFKIKTTRPARYVVRPNAGVLPPGVAAAVEISLTPGAAVPPPAALCRDKFLVQAGAVLPGMAIDDAFWGGAAFSRTKLTVAVEGYSVESAAAAGGGVGGGSVPASTPPSPGRRPPSRPPSYASASSGVRDGVASSPPPAPGRPGVSAGGLAATSVAAHVAQLQAGSTAAGSPLPPTGRAGRFGAAAAAIPATGTVAGVATPAPALTDVADKDGLPPAGVAGARPGDAALATEYGALLAPGRHDEAVERAREVGRALDASRAEAARLRTAVEETVAAAETILEEAPKAPLATHVLASDAYGGVSVAGVGLMVAAAAVLTKLVW